MSNIRDISGGFYFEERRTNLDFWLFYRITLPGYFSIFFLNPQWSTKMSSKIF